MSCIPTDSPVSERFMTGIIFYYPGETRQKRLWWMRRCLWNGWMQHVTFKPAIYYRKAKQLSIKRVAQFKSLTFWKGERWLHDRQKRGLAEAYYLCWHKEERHNLFLCERQFRCHSNWYPFLSFIWQPEWAGLPPVSYFQRYFYAVTVDPWTLSMVSNVSVKILLRQ